MAPILDGKVALITGGSSGIGRSAGVCFARAGARVVVAARRVDAGEQTVQIIREAGCEARFVRTDVSQAAEVRALVHSCVERYGRLDYAVNNAGIEGSIVPMIDYTEDDWDAIIDINLKGVWLCMKIDAHHAFRRPLWYHVGHRTRSCSSFWPLQAASCRRSRS